MIKFKIKKYLYFGILIWLFFFSLINQVLADSNIDSLPVNLGVAGITKILYVIAFIGGALMILTPCSAATIPAYFANAFGSKGKIVQRTFIFFLGFSLVYAFIGAGSSFIGRLLNIYIEPLALIAGLLLVFFGLLVLIGKGFFSLPTARVNTKRTAKGTFLFGTLFAVGFVGCTGPMLAGILTVASQLSTTQAILLMFFYSLGIGVPLMLLSLVFDRYKIYNSKFFRLGKEIKILGKSVYLSLSNVISGLLLIVLGIVFIIFRETSVLSAGFPRKITDMGYALQDWLLVSNLPSYIDTILFIVVGFFLIKFLGKKFHDPNQKWQITIDFSKIKLTLIFIVVVLFIFNSFLYFDQKSLIKKQIAGSKERARPANLELTIITAPDCSDCFNIDEFIDFLKDQNVKITSENKVEFNSDEGKRLIQENKIERIPTFVVRGEINKDSALKSFFESVGEIKDDTFIFEKINPPYILTESGEVKGRFELTYISVISCVECYDVILHNASLTSFGMKISKDKTVDISSKEGKELLKKYDITKVPTILLSGDLEEYSIFQRIWPQVGTVVSDGTYIFLKTEVMGIYKDLETGKIIGAEN